ncbi:MAG: hypothetical protein SCAL_001626 [Candidatus Syntrophoarchaeum caldarius]|uniref:Uncharacterized protein n=1 Tax=Candidatus Syntropharchaeum caldarium TaxID=1838285 RepID=A0A1F2P7M3_9EURY|nr:MAG: hypothetical protein SCAL_001626 [Candidatus Syntrophoarchaeum caldarius]
MKERAGAKIEDLQLKTKIKEYYKYDFDELLGILKENRKKISVNPSSREFQANLKEEFEGSIGKLKPLIERIEKTDWLTDKLIYEL